MKLINWINSKTKIMAKTDFKYECTYIWATLLFHSFVIGFSLGLTFEFIGWHLNTFIPEFTKEYFPRMVAKNPNVDFVTTFVLIMADASVILAFYVYSLTPEKLVKFEEGIVKFKVGFEARLEKGLVLLGRPVGWFGNKCLAGFELVLSKFCRQIPKE